MNDKRIITSNKQTPKNDPDLEKAAALLMAALAWSESHEGQAAMLKADCNQPKQTKEGKP